MQPHARLERTAATAPSAARSPLGVAPMFDASAAFILITSIRAPNTRREAPIDWRARQTASRALVGLCCGLVFAFRTTLAPRGDRGGIDLFVVWTLHEIDDAVSPHQIAGGDEGIFFGCKCATDTIAVQSTIKIVRGPAHAVLVGTPRTSRAATSLLLFHFEIYRRFLAAAALNFVFNDLSFVE